VPALRQRHGADRVIASDVRIIPYQLSAADIHEHLDCTQPSRFSRWCVVMRSAPSTTSPPCFQRWAEEKPHAAWSITWTASTTYWRRPSVPLPGFFPSSIGAFGPSTPRSIRHKRPFSGRPQFTASPRSRRTAVRLLCQPIRRRCARPAVAGPYLLCRSARRRDDRLCGGNVPSGARYKHYSCFLKADARLPMMYMPDAIRATIALMEADGARLRIVTPIMSRR